MVRRLVVIFLLLVAANRLFGQAASEKPDFTFSIPGTHVWTDTGLDVQAGDVLQISASVETATVPDRHTIAGAGACDPKGMTGTVATGTELPLASAPVGALIAKLHQEQTAPSLVGVASELKADAPGRLYLSANVADAPVCQGNFQVAVHRTKAGEPTAEKTASVDKTEAQKSRGTELKSQLSAAAQIFMQGQFGIGKPEAKDTGASNATSNGASAEGAKSAAALKVSGEPLDAKLRQRIDGLPRRVNDQFKNQGDMVNFVIVGSENDVKAALDAANWHAADTENQKAVLSAVMETIAKKDYLQMPMSTLYLFDRRQDYGYEQAEPIAMVASRHHFRIWKAPFTWKDTEVWVGAGTHDIGFAKDQRNGSVTHKIDPAVDGERDNIGSSLQESGKTRSLTYYLPPNPVQDAKNATGDGYHSDGRLLVIILQ